MAPASLVMIVMAPFLGRLTDKTGGKWILVSGLTLFAVGMGWVLIAGTDSTWQDFLAPLIVAGLGMGGTLAPLTTVAMREVDPRMAGAASGMLNTVRQVGSVIGTAAVGALLQARLASSLTSQATIGSAALPGQLQRLATEVFSQGYVLAMRWTMVMPIAVVVLAAASCLAIRNRTAAPDGPAGAGERSGQMAGTISSPGSLGSLGSSGQSPGSSSGTAS
jgi:MFS family permease